MTFQTSSTIPNSNLDYIQILKWTKDLTKKVRLRLEVPYNTMYIFDVSVLYSEVFFRVLFLSGWNWVCQVKIEYKREKDIEVTSAFYISFCCGYGSKLKHKLRSIILRHFKSSVFSIFAVKDDKYFT